MPGGKGHLAVPARFVDSMKATPTAEQPLKAMAALARMMDREPFDENVIPG